jgi:hypothetical protein
MTFRCVIQESIETGVTWNILEIKIRKKNNYGPRERVHFMDGLYRRVHGRDL